MNKRIQETTDYSRFDLHEINRYVRPNKKSTKALVESMRVHGWLDAYPMMVVRNGIGNDGKPKLLIKSGHHRFDCARRLKMGVKYVIENSDITIHELERSTNNWTLEDFLVSYVKLGNNHYIYVDSFCDKTGIAPSMAISMLGGEDAATYGPRVLFKNGTFEVADDITHAHDVAFVVTECSRMGIPFASTGPFVQAVSYVNWVPEFSPELFLDKVSKYPDKMRKRHSRKEYIELIEEVYNHRNRANECPLAYRAKQEARKRNPSIGGE